MKKNLIILIICFFTHYSNINAQPPQPKLNKEIIRFQKEIIQLPITSQKSIDSVLLFHHPQISEEVVKHTTDKLLGSKGITRWVDRGGQAHQHVIDLFYISDYNITPSTPTIGHAFQVNYNLSNLGLGKDKIALVNEQIYLNGVLQNSQNKKDISVTNNSTIASDFSFTISQPGNGYKLKLYLKNQTEWMGCVKIRTLNHDPTPCPISDSVEIDFNVSQDYSLSGLWQADDSGIYYISQQGKQFWWAGLSDDRGLQNGLTFCNIFKGTITGDQIDGEWADVPRGLSMSSGQMSLKIVFDDAGNPISLQKQSSAPVGFGASHWDRNFLPTCGGSLFNLIPIDDLFKSISKNTYYYDYGDATPELEKLRRNLEPIKEPVVLYGTLALGSAPDFLPLEMNSLTLMIGLTLNIWNYIIMMQRAGIQVISIKEARSMLI